MRQVQADRIVKANPKMVLKCNVVGTPDPPLVEFEFVDGDKVSITQWVYSTDFNSILVFYSSSSF